MTVLGPNDPRAYRSTGKTWTDSFGKEHPIMLDPQGNEVRVVSGSMADMMRPDFIERLDSQLVEAGGSSIIDAVLRGLEGVQARREAHSTVRIPSSPVGRESAAAKARREAEEQMEQMDQAEELLEAESEEYVAELAGDLRRENVGRRRFQIQGSKGAPKVKVQKQAPRPKDAAPDGGIVSALNGALDEKAKAKPKGKAPADPKADLGLERQERVRKFIEESRALAENQDRRTVEDILRMNLDNGIHPRVKVVYQIEGLHRKPRYTVGRISELNTKTVWLNLRPEAGNWNMPRKEVIKMEIMPDDSPVVIDKIVK